jgi:uncharacterized protein (TIGR03790 family)
MTAAAQGPDNVLVVVNKASAISRQAADYYVARRAIPSANVCLIDAPEQETISRAVFDNSVAAPVAGCLKSKRLEEKILYLVTTLGVPLRIEGSGGREGEQASVDSELAMLYADMHGPKHSLAGPLRNPFFGARREPFAHPRFPMYLVCRLAAYNLADVKAMIDRSLAASNRGRVVLDLQSPDNAAGNNWLRDAAMLLPKDRVILEETTAVLYDRRDVIGYAAWGSNDSNRTRRFLGFHWLPGAIVSEYVSTDGRTFTRPPDNWTFTSWTDKAHWFSGSPQGLSADYLHEGATGASGHVYEPYLGFTPRPDYLLPAYLNGRNLAESYYLSIQGLSWQNIVIGDPLCRLQ